MSLPDTAFIFVLALIIFGPKKLPEIGRQLGRLVGEFRRASNEFKYQIEEELRLAELSDQTSTSTRSSTAESSSSEPDSTSSDSETEDSDGSYPTYQDDSTESYPTDTDDSTESYPTDTDEMLPIGQHPNPDYQGSYELNDHDGEQAELEFAEKTHEGEASEQTAPTIRAAAGSQPRTSLPYANTEPAEATAVESISSVMSDAPDSEPGAHDADIPSAENATPMPEHEPTDPNTAPTVADVTHG